MVSRPGLVALLVVLLSWAPSAHAGRVTLLQFEGPRSQQLKWRVSGALKRGGHSVFPMRAPSPSSPPSRFHALALRQELDVLIAGQVVEEGDRWTLTMTLRGADGKKLKQTLTFEGSSLSALVQDVKSNVASRLDDVLGGGKSAGAADERVVAGEDDTPNSRRARKASTGRSRAVVDLDEPDGAPSADDEAPPARAGKKRKASPAAADAEEGEINLDAAESADAEPAASGADSQGGEDAASDPLSDPAVDEGTSDTRKKKPSQLPFVRVTAGAGIVSRSLDYVDDIYDRLRTQQTTSTVLRLDAQAYVFARSVRDYFGLIASFEGAITGKVEDTDSGGSFGVKYSELMGGVRARYPIDAHEIGADITFGALSSALDRGDEANVPDFNYAFVRPALYTTLRFGDVWARSSLAVRVPTGYGELSDREWFPRVGGYGLEGLLGLEYRVSRLVGIELSGTLRRFVLTMNSAPADATGGVSEVAAGAVDSYLSAYLGLNFSL